MSRFSEIQLTEAGQNTNGHSPNQETVVPLAGRERKKSLFEIDDAKHKRTLAALSENLTGEYVDIFVTSTACQLTWARIRNPLIGIPKQRLIEDVEAFAQQYGITDIRDNLIKGALVAQNPLHVDQIEELDDEDRRVLHEEVTHKWKHPRTLYLTIILNSVAAAIQGWDQTGKYTSLLSPILPRKPIHNSCSGSNGANLTFSQALGIPDTGPFCDIPANSATCDKNSWIVGFINSCPYIAICVLYDYPSNHELDLTYLA